ncbi:hypothetical protein GCM10010195_34000 [Kitasatospora griseola]|nr:hypothetical protein GCM10010195_34000 [Kitasatospora griseola]
MVKRQPLRGELRLYVAKCLLWVEQWCPVLLRPGSSGGEGHKDRRELRVADHKQTGIGCAPTWLCELPHMEPDLTKWIIGSPLVTWWFRSAVKDDWTEGAGL